MSEEKKTNLKSKTHSTSSGSAKIKRTFEGIVMSDKSDKTVVVRIDRVKMHSKYHKRYTVSKNFKAHDEKNEYKIGDKVIIQECRPLSKDKHWRVIGKFGHGLVVGDNIKDKELEELDSAKEVERIEHEVEKVEGNAASKDDDGSVKEKLGEENKDASVEEIEK